MSYGSGMAIFSRVDTSEGALREARLAVKRRVLGYIAAGLGFVAGLAWNDAIKSIIDYLVPDRENSLAAKLLYAVAITLFVSIALIYVERSMDRGDDGGR